jgi:tRNA(adenine34) deaminase
MNEEYYQLVRQRYPRSRGDSTQLFQTILSIAQEIGLDNALACLEQCVVEKRLSWWDRNAETLEKTGDPLHDGYRMFYECYLGLSTPHDGEIVEATDRRLVARWWNPCSTLAACQKFGLDTREICKKAYHQPVQVLLSKIDPRLRFERNYAALRPYTPYCEEIIRLEEVDGCGSVQNPDAQDETD